MNDCGRTQRSGGPPGTSFWNNGIANPLTVIEQPSYLIFMRRLDDDELMAEKRARRLGKPPESRFGADQQHLRWSQLKQQADPAEQLRLTALAFDHMKRLPGMDDTPYARHMKDAVFLVGSPSLISSAIRQLDEIFDLIHGPLSRRDVPCTIIRQLDEIFDLIHREEAQEASRTQEATSQGLRKDLKGDLYEYMLSKLLQAGTNGQFRTPRHIIRMMVELRRPRLEDTICDPACGTAGFLVSAAEYLAEEYGPELVVDRDCFEHYRGPMFAGFEFDGTMLRIASMNLMLHGIEHPDVQEADSLSDPRKDVRGRFTLILANPPFKGSVDMDVVAEDLLNMVGLARQPKKKKMQTLPLENASLAEEKKAPGAKTELLFLAQILGALKVGGRAAVIVPDGVLFGSSRAHVAIRKKLVEEQLLEGIVSMPAGVFKLYAGVSTAVILFARSDAGGTDKVWFYDMTADGYSLDDKRQQVAENDIPDVIRRWRGRDEAQDTERTAKAFFVPKAEIVGEGYDLSINRYNKVEHKAVTHEAPSVLLERLMDLEKQIQSGLEELRGLVG